MNTEKSQSEVWESIKDLYQWRKGQAEPQVRYVYDSIKAGQDAGTEAQREAFNAWKNHPNEEVFFTLNYLRPDEIE